MSFAGGASGQEHLHYAAFVSMFPHLIAGPIVRYSTMEGQLQRLAPRLSPQLAASGLFFFACGLAKKLLVADTLAPHVDSLFALHQHLTLVSGWAAGIGYSLQLYFDFSGYSDMAVGLAYLLGFRFPQNFNSPYKSVNISDFWRRWHMSLRSGFATTCSSRSADRKAAAGGRFATSRSRCSSAACGTARPGRSSSGGCSTASSWWCTVSAETTVSHRAARS